MSGAIQRGNGWRGHLPSIDMLIKHADIIAADRRAKANSMPAGAGTDVLGNLLLEANRARHAADWLRKLAAEIRNEQYAAAGYDAQGAR